MKKAFLSLVFTLTTFQFLWAQVPTLGTYPSTTIATAGGNAIVTPSAAPANTVNITATTSANFKGLLHVNPVTGVVSVTNAHPAGSYVVTVKGFNGPQTTTTGFTLTVNNPNCSQGLFTTAGNVSTGASPRSVAIGDFNSDGQQDIAIANLNSSTISIRLGDGVGNFTGLTNIAVGSGPISVAIGDFNGDGKQDLASSNNYTNTVSIRLGDGMGNFTGTKEITVGYNPGMIVTADFNSDGQLDLAISYLSGNTIETWLGDGEGGFLISTNVSAGNNTKAIALGDFNNDGKPDITIIIPSTNSVSIRLGNGTGGFSGSTVLAVGSNPQSIAISDFNGDGKQDFVTANYTSGNASIRLGDGAGGFSGTMNIPVGNNAIAVVAGDFNGDGRQDFACAQQISSGIFTVFWGDGTGFFLRGANTSVGNSPTAIAIGDFNNDGKQDVATANLNFSTLSVSLGNIDQAEINIQGNNTNIADGSSNPSIADHTDFGNVSAKLVRTFTIQNTGTGSLPVASVSITGSDAAMYTLAGISLPALIPTGSSAVFTVSFVPTSTGIKNAQISIVSGDCDESMYDFAIQGSGFAAAATLGTYPATTIASAGGNTTIIPSSPPGNVATITAQTSTNFKGLLFADPETGLVSVTNAHPNGIYNIMVKASNGFTNTSTSFTLTVDSYVGCSQGVFGGSTNLATGTNPTSIAVGDFNNDGKQDLAMAEYGSNSIAVRLGDGMGGFTGTTSMAAGVNPIAIAGADFDGDGKTDIAFANYNSQNVSVMRGDGSGGFGGNITILTGLNPSALAAADFNGDGIKDLAITNYGSNNVSVVFGNGFGNFGPISNFTVGTNPTSITIGDFNNDNKTDFATANYGSYNVSVQLGNGLGGFTAGTNVSVGYQPYHVVIGDFDNDGNQDLCVANYGSATVSIRAGTGTGSFSGFNDVPVGNLPYALSTGDFNSDGNQDFAVANSGSSTVSVRLGTGLGVFTNGSTIATGSSPRSLAVGDFNGDGKQDAAIANYNSHTILIRLGAINEINLQGNSISIADGSSSPSLIDHTDFGTVTSKVTRSFTIQNIGTGNLTTSKILITGVDSAMFSLSGVSLPAITAPGASTTFTVSFLPTSSGLKNVVVSVLNDDCDEAVYDFAIQGTGVFTSPLLGNYGSLTVNTAGGNATLTPSEIPQNAVKLSAYTAAGFMGVLHTNPSSGLVTITNAYPAGTYTVYVKGTNGFTSTTTTFTLTVGNTNCSQALFSSPASPNITSNPRPVAIGDFNNDGKQDIVATSQSTGVAFIRLGNGIGGFTGTASISIGSGPEAIVVGDFNNDGNQDFAVGCTYSSYLVTIRLGDGQGGFSVAPNIITTSAPVALAAGDFNNDGLTDLAIANSTVSIRFGDGTGQFAGNTEIPLSGTFVAIGDFNGDYNQDLAITDDYYGTVFIRLGNGAGNFSTGNDVSVGGSKADKVIISDFNNDGKQDLASSINNGSTVSVRLGDGAGNFSGTENMQIGFGAKSIVSGDFNGDGNQDFAVGNDNLSVISVRLGDGNGGFRVSTDISIGSSQYSLAVGDFNGDGKQDIVCTSLSNSVSIRLGIPDIAEINVKGNNINIADGDNTPAVNDFTDFENVTSYLVRNFTIQNTGTGTLPVGNITITGVDSSLFKLSGITLPLLITAGSSATFSVTFSPTSAGFKNAVVNIQNEDCDEKLYNFTLKGMGVVSLPSLGTYAPTTISSIGATTTIIPSVTAGNAVTTTATTSVHFKGKLLVNNETGLLKVVNAYPAGSYTVTVRAFNAFGITTTSFVLTVNNAGCSPGLFTGISTVAAGINPSYSAVGDFNGDGRQDLIISNTGDNSSYPSTVSVRLGDGAGGFTGSTNLPAGLSPRAVATGDFNGDGKQDFVVANFTSHYVAGVVNVRLGNGLGGFTAAPDVLAGSIPLFILVADFNNDGIQDLATLNNQFATVSIRLGDGKGGFSGTTEVAGNYGPQGMAVTDLNGDGNADLVIAYTNSTQVGIHLGNGTGGFTAAPEITVSVYPKGIATGDFNGDGKQDFISAHMNYSTAVGSVCIRLGNGSGGFSTATQLDAGLGLTDIQAGDFNGDGKLDFAVCNGTNNTLSVYAGNGAGGFVAGSPVSLSSIPYQLTVGDFNDDGKQDLAAVTYQNIAIKLNTDKEININTGNANVADGDLTPSVAKGTDYGITEVNSSTFKTFAIQNKGNRSLTINSITVTGQDASMFVIGNATFPLVLDSGRARIIFVTFIPTSPGLKTAVINIASDDCDEGVYDFAVQGGLRAAALDFDGINDHITINNTSGNIGTTATTISAWIKTTTAGTIISKRNTCTQGNELDFGITATGHLAFGLSDNNTTNQQLTGNAIVTDGQWHNVTAIRNGTTLSLYVDGILDTTTITTAITNINNTALLMIGASGCNGASNFFNGQMDELRFWNKALSTCDIQKTMRCEMTGTQSGLLAYYKFNQGRALDNNSNNTSLSDSGGNTNNGTLNNFALNGATSNWVAQGAIINGMVCNNTSIWLGISADWGLAANWSQGFVPLECTDVVINSGTPFMPEISNASGTCYSIRLNNGATVTVKGIGRLNIVGKN